MSAEDKSAPTSPSAGSVDPYGAWLGIETAERPPSCYALLGLRELENDPAIIAAAARQARKMVRAYQIGKYRKEALALLREIGEATNVLLDLEKKAAYDEERLRQATSQAKAGFPLPDAGRPPEEALAQWLTRAEQMGLPTLKLLPDLLRWCLEQPAAWPIAGPENIPLPLGLWLYFEAAVVGQCVERRSIDLRVAAVKRLQQLFGISEQLSRIINLDIGRRPQAFTDSEPVLLAAERPRDLMQQWLDRLALRNIDLAPTSKIYESLALLLGLVNENGEAVADPVRPRTVRRPAPSGAGRVLREMIRLTQQIADGAADLRARYPTAAFVVLAAVAVALVIFLLLASF